MQLNLDTNIGKTKPQKRLVTQLSLDHHYWQNKKEEILYIFQFNRTQRSFSSRQIPKPNLWNDPIDIKYSYREGRLQQGKHHNCCNSCTYTQAWYKSKTIM